jgi:serine/threonine protein kinase
LYQRFKYGRESSTLEIDNNSSPNYLDNITENETYRKILDEPFNKAFELHPSRLQIDKTCLLGSGAFGIVFQGILDDYKTVAVKTIQDPTDNDKLDALLSELKIMSYVGRHPNVVQLFGAQIADLRKGIVYVAIEFCPLGSLEQVLQIRRKQLEAKIRTGQFNNFMNMPEYMPVASEVKPFSTHQLLLFSHQVACGMEFLASRKVSNF